MVRFQSAPLGRSGGLRVVCPADHLRWVKGAKAQGATRAWPSGKGRAHLAVEGPAVLRSAPPPVLRSAFPGLRGRREFPREPFPHSNRKIWFTP